MKIKLSERAKQYIFFNYRKCWLGSELTELQEFDYVTFLINEFENYNFPDDVMKNYVNKYEDAQEPDSIVFNLFYAEFLNECEGGERTRRKQYLESLKQTETKTLILNI